jgi:hypothetical protein
MHDHSQLAGPWSCIARSLPAPGLSPRVNFSRHIEDGTRMTDACGVCLWNSHKLTGMTLPPRILIVMYHSHVRVPSTWVERYNPEGYCP